MTEHLTRHGTEYDTEHGTEHGTEHDEDLAGREDVREPDTAEVPAQEGTDFREPGADDRRDDEGDHTLSTADLASASADTRADDRTDDRADARPAESGGDVETPELIDEEKVTGFRDRWQNVQTGFVDDPKQAVRQADELVAAVISALATTFAEHKSELEAQWQQGEPATEELRIALRRYRSFFDQLLPR